MDPWLVPKQSQTSSFGFTGAASPVCGAPRLSNFSSYFSESSLAEIDTFFEPFGTRYSFGYSPQFVSIGGIGRRWSGNFVWKHSLALTQQTGTASVTLTLTLIHLAFFHHSWIKSQDITTPPPKAKSFPSLEGSISFELESSDFPSSYFTLNSEIFECMFEVLFRWCQENTPDGVWHPP